MLRAGTSWGGGGGGGGGISHGLLPVIIMCFIILWICLSSTSYFKIMIGCRCCAEQRKPATCHGFDWLPKKSSTFQYSSL